MRGHYVSIIIRVQGDGLHDDGLCFRFFHLVPRLDLTRREEQEESSIGHEDSSGNVEYFVPLLESWLPIEEKQLS